MPPEALDFCGQTVPLLVGREARPLMGWRARPGGVSTGSIRPRAAFRGLQ